MSDKVLLVTVMFEVSLVAILLQQVVRIAAVQPISSWSLWRWGLGLPLLALPASRDWGRETWRKRETGEGQVHLQKTSCKH